MNPDYSIADWVIYRGTLTQALLFNLSVAYFPGFGSNLPAPVNLSGTGWSSKFAIRILDRLVYNIL